jgi:uncharacterized membrane protein YedE/YeeE
MRVLENPGPKMGFDFGLMPGVFAGSAIGALIGREWQLEGFKDGHSMRRYIVGAVLMGFGAMLAGGCAVGAGITGGAIFAVTAWLSLLGMWLGAGLTDRLVDRTPPAATEGSAHAFGTRRHPAFKPRNTSCTFCHSRTNRGRCGRVRGP